MYLNPANSGATDRGRWVLPLITAEKSEAALAFETDRLMSVRGLLRPQGGRVFQSTPSPTSRCSLYRKS